MKRKQMKGLANSLASYLCSRNNDIAGYWGVGVLCRLAKSGKASRFSFRISPGQVLRIYGYEISGSHKITEKLMRHDLSSIEARMAFVALGKLPDGRDRYCCSITVAVTQDGRTGLGGAHVFCWPHDSFYESRRG